MLKTSLSRIAIAVSLSSLLFSGCGSSSELSGASGRIQLQTGGGLSGYGYGPGTGDPVPFGPDGARQYLYITESQEGTLGVYDGDTYSRVAQINVGPDPRGLSFDTTRNRVLISRLNGSVLSLDANNLSATPRSVTPVVDAGSTCLFYDLSNDAIWVTSLSLDNSIASLAGESLNHLSGSPINNPDPLEHYEGLGNVIVEPSGQRAFITQSVSEKAGVLVVNTANRTVQHRIDTVDPSGDGNDSADGIAYHSDFRLLFVGNLDYDGNPDGQVVVLDASVNPPVIIQRIACGEGASCMAIDYRRNRLYVTNYDFPTFSASAVQVYSITNSGSPLSFLATLPTRSGPVSVIYDSAHDRIISSNFDDDTITVYNAETLREIPGSPFSTRDGPNSLYFR